MAASSNKSAGKTESNQKDASHRIIYRCLETDDPDVFEECISRHSPVEIRPICEENVIDDGEKYWLHSVWSESWPTRENAVSNCMSEPVTNRTGTAIGRCDTNEYVELFSQQLQIDDQYEACLERREIPVNRFSFRDDEGYSFLHLAIIDEKPRDDVIFGLIDTCPTTGWLDLRNHKGLTALHLAVYLDRREIVEWLLEAGASVDFCEFRNGDNVALFACRHNRPECLAAIVDSLRRRRTTTSGNELARLLQTTDNEGLACLHLAWKLDDKTIFWSLLNDEDSVDVNQQERKHGKTLLHMSAAKGDEQVVKALIDMQSVDVCRLTYDGYAAHQMARNENIREMIMTRLPADFVESPCNSLLEDSMEVDVSW